MAAVELSVFGLASKVDITVLTLALTGVVGFIVVFEMGAHRLEHHLAGTPYMGMLAKIYKELMIMGFIALGVFLTLELGSVGDSLEFFTFEFAHIVIFFTTLIFVMQACLMMVFSAKLKNRYERSTNISVDHLLSIYSLHRKSKVFHARWLPLSDLREVMEFKIVHAFFRTTFALPTNFDFALYMREASDSHILSLVDVEGSTWFILAVFCFLNLARVKIWQAIGLTPMDSDHADDDHATDDHAASDYASDHASDDHRRWLAGAGGSVLYTNTGSDGEATFILFGWIMLCTAIGNYIMSRWVEIRLLRKAGCNSTQDYQERLCVIEKHFMEAKRLEEVTRQGAKGNHLELLKRQVDDAKKMGDKGHQKHKQGGHGAEDGGNLQSRISRHLDQARKHAKAATHSFGSGDVMKGIAGSQPGSPSFRFRGLVNKVVPGAESPKASTLQWPSVKSLAPLALNNTTATESSEEDVPSSPQGRTASARGAAMISPTATDRTEVVAVRSPSMSEVSSAGAQQERREEGPTVAGPRAGAAQQEGREEGPTEAGPRTGLGAGPGTGLGGTEGGSEVSMALLRMYKDVVTDRGVVGQAVDEVGGQAVAGGGRDGQGRDGGGGEEQWEEGGGRGEGRGKREKTGVDGGTAGRDGRKRGGGDGQEDRYVINIPSAAEDTDKSIQQPPLTLVIAREPPELSEEDQCSDRNITDKEPSSAVEASRNSGTESSHGSTGRRPSLLLKHQVRRMSVSARKLTARLASDVTSVARKISNAPHSSSTLDLFNDISDIYPLSSPTLFHKTLDVLLLSSCTYLALWIVNFMSVANAKPYSFLRHAAILLPAAGVFLSNALSVKTSSLLLAISAMDPAIIGKVLDEQIDQEKLLVQFRERLMSRLDELGLGKSGLETAFEEVDVTGRGELTIRELSQVLFRLNFHTSKEKYKKLFNAMDKNRKGVVSYHQLFELVYIEEAAAQEARALKMKGKLHAIK